MKNISIAIAAFCALAGQSAVASAQSARGWSPWDQGGPATAQADDDRYYDRYEQDDARRYDDRQNGDRVYDDRYDDGRAQEQRGVRAWRNEDLDDYGQWDAAPSAAEEAQRNKAPGVSGGARPSIRPVAPPQVAFHAPYAPGSIVIDTSARKLYYVTSATTAFAYPIGVGREGFAWTGKEKVSRIADWPDWYPPADMRQRRPDLPERMLGGIGNPLGVKAIYLGNTLYRIHGTNDPKSIGKAESSGCFRMMNGNVLHLASLVKIGTEVTIVRSLKGNGSVVASSKPAPRAASPRAYNEDERTVSQRAPQPRWDDRYYDPYYRGGREPSPYDDDWR
jgi:lipoprotein-anchoring transpeptidase ErfK/SrfK